MRALPEGIVTFLFSDVEGSTRLLERHGAATGRALARHHELFRELVTQNKGVIFETVGDAVYAAFSQPADALHTAIGAHRAFLREGWGEVGRLAVRIAVHTGPVDRRGEHYFGEPLFRAARLQALAHGEQTLLSGLTVQLVRGGLPDGAALRDLGTHRLQDLGEPEHVFQLTHPDLRAEFPPLKTLDSHPHNLPVHLSRFVGRSEEIAEVGALLATNRLVTLLGPGGTGKTRLALQVAANRQDAYPDGVWFTDLTEIRDTNMLEEGVARTLGLPTQPDVDLGALLLQYLARHHLLLILDNLEQVGAEAAHLVREWLRVSPQLTILATSRLRLGMPDEVEIPVHPLPLPATDDPTAVLTSPAGELFLLRARASGAQIAADSSSARAVSTLLRRLDGLPLAIELAAARTRIMTPQEITNRLDDRGLSAIDPVIADHHRSLLRILDWTLDLLSPNELNVLTALCTFAGFDLRMVDELAPESDAVEVLDQLVSVGLVDSSVTAVGTRFNVLETIRSVVAARTSADAEVAHLDSHARAVATSVLDFLGRERDAPADTFERLDTEAANLRRAFGRLSESDPVLGIELWDAVFYPFWTRMGRLREGMTWLESTAKRVDPPTLELSRAWVKYAMNSPWILDDGSVSAAMRQAVRIARDVGDHVSELAALSALAGQAVNEGDASVAREIAARLSAMDLDDLGDPSRMRAAEAHHHVNVILHGFASDEAIQPLTEAIRFAEKAGEERARIAMAGNLAIARLHRADFASAVEAAELAVDLGRSIDSALLPWTLSILAMARAGMAEVSASIAILGEAIEATVDVDMPVQTCDTLLAGIPVAIAAGDERLACRLWGAASEMERAGSVSIPKGDRALAERSLKHVRSLMPALAVELAIQDGARADPLTLLRTVPGLLVVTAGAKTTPARALRHGRLTKREVEVLALVADGKTDTEIAEALFISPKTASVHVSSGKGKLGAHSRLDLALKVRALGLGPTGAAEPRPE